MTRTPLFLGLLALLPLAANAQTAAWSVVAGEDARIPMSPLQGNSERTIDKLYLSGTASDRFGFRHGSPDADRGLWARTNGAFVRYMQYNVNGVTGPGRTGTDAGHVFTQLHDEYEDVAPDGSRVFLARAGNPAVPSTLSNGAWVWTGSGNREVARSLDVGTLGPGLNDGSYIDGSSGFQQLRALGGGQVLADVSVIGPTTARNEVIFKHVPGVGNQACAMSNSTNALLSPGITAGDTFERWSSNTRIRTVDTQGRIYGQFAVSGSRTGIFELCNGAPRALAVDEDSGARGPGIPGNPNAVFTSFYNGAVLGAPGLFHYVAIAQIVPGGSSVNGVYRNDGTRNRPLALSGDTGEFSPHWAGSVFTVFEEATLDAAGRYVTFGADVNAGGQSVSGVWRAGSSAGPRPAAIKGVVGEFGPGPGLTWTSFGARTVLSNGDIVMRANTSDGVTGLWLLQEGKAARRILAIGDTVTVPTTSGPANVAVNDWSLPAAGGTAVQYMSSRDGWASADGTILVRATVATYGAVWLTAKPSNPNDYLYKDGFGG